MRAHTLLLPLLLAGAAWAADITPLDVKLGLWETKSTTQMPAMRQMPAIPPEALAQMPPEQRARLEAMSKGGPMVHTVKTCMTREKLNNPTSISRVPKSCTPKVVLSSSTKQKIHVDCEQEGMKMSGDLEIERVDSQHMKGNMTMSGPAAMKMSFETSWIAADCGAVK